MQQLDHVNDKRDLVGSQSHLDVRMNGEDVMHSHLHLIPTLDKAPIVLWQELTFHTLWVRQIKRFMPAVQIVQLEAKHALLLDRFWIAEILPHGQAGVEDNVEPMHTTPHQLCECVKRPPDERSGRRIDHPMTKLKIQDIHGIEAVCNLRLYRLQDPLDLLDWRHHCPFSVSCQAMQIGNVRRTQLKCFAQGIQGFWARAPPPLLHLDDRCCPFPLHQGCQSKLRNSF